MDKKNVKLFINKEISLIEFNARILCLANNKNIPLLERFKFLCIFSSNMDEYFETRFYVLKHHSQQDHSLVYLMKDISSKVHKLVHWQYEILETILHELSESKISFDPSSVWTKELYQWAKNYFQEHILPVLTPLVIDQSHPMPNLINKSINFIVELEGQDFFGNSPKFAIIGIPRSLPRLIQIPQEVNSESLTYLMLMSIIKNFSHEIFDGMKIVSCYAFRITRNSMLNYDDYAMDEFTNRVDLAELVKSKLNLRPYGVAIRIEVEQQCPEHIYKLILEKHSLSVEDLYLVSTPINLTSYLSLYDTVNRPDLKFTNYHPAISQELIKNNNIFNAIRKNDVILHHPYDSFDPVVQFIYQAAVDPDVISIKQTLYRVGSNSAIIDALAQAAAAGKQVVVVIELKANFDEYSNLNMATRLQKAGAIVVYGVMNYKIHCKITLVIRKERNSLAHYSHIGTGNYNSKTAHNYTDYSLFTCNDEIGTDIQNLFNQITGTRLHLNLNKIISSPVNLKEFILNRIQTEMDNSNKGQTSFLFAKVNGLSDEGIIQKLYEASQAGVKIVLVVRGMCCLLPGMAGLSENIRVFSFLGRWLEHERVYYFFNGGIEKVYIASADWRTRNIHKRVEVCVPIENLELKNQIIETTVLTHPAHECYCWELNHTGKYEPIELTAYTNYMKSVIDQRSHE